MDRKSYQRQKSRRASMDSISLPSEDKVKGLSEPSLNTRSKGVSRTADEIFTGVYARKPGQFDRATKFYGTVEEKMLEHAHDDDEDDFIPKPDPTKKAPGLMDKGVKVRGTYVRRGKVFFWIAVALIIFVSALLFLPPVMSSTAEDTKVLYERNVFEDMGLTEFKSYALQNYTVVNEDAFSSEKKESYRVIQLGIHLQNSAPFAVKIPQYDVAHVNSKYKDKICYITSTRTDGTTKIVGDEVPGLGGTDVVVEIMVNVSDMTDEDLDECLTSLVIKTSGAGKHMGGGKYLPCIPGFLFVSNNINVAVNK